MALRWSRGSRQSTSTPSRPQILNFTSTCGIKGLGGIDTHEFSPVVLGHIWNLCLSPDGFQGKHETDNINKLWGEGWVCMWERERAVRSISAVTHCSNPHFLYTSLAGWKLVFSNCSRSNLEATVDQHPYFSIITTWLQRKLPDSIVKGVTNGSSGRQSFTLFMKVSRRYWATFQPYTASRKQTKKPETLWFNLLCQLCKSLFHTAGMSQWGWSLQNYSGQTVFLVAFLLPV